MVQKVSEWQNIYLDLQSKRKNGKKSVKRSREEAARQVNMSKKTLDDYLLQIRHAKRFRFNFDANLD